MRGNLAWSPGYRDRKRFVPRIGGSIGGVESALRSVSQTSLEENEKKKRSQRLRVGRLQGSPKSGRLVFGSRMRWGEENAGRGGMIWDVDVGREVQGGESLFQP
jgi:hypothetical protein